jgi:hypothetical protein
MRDPEDLREGGKKCTIRACSSAQIICLWFSYIRIPRRVCSLPIEVLVFLSECLRLSRMPAQESLRRGRKKEEVTEHFQWHEENYIHQLGIY